MKNETLLSALALQRDAVTIGIGEAASLEQRNVLEQMLRNGPLDIGGAPHVQRPIFEEMLRSTPVRSDVRVELLDLDGVQAVRFTPDTEPVGMIFYLHGGAYALGSAEAAAGFVSELSSAARCVAYAVDYRLSPEHPHPAALDDAFIAYCALADANRDSRIAIAGDSAGAGLALALLVRIRLRGRAVPSAAALMSPWADLSLQAASLVSKADVDPALRVEGLRIRAADYAGTRHLTDSEVSPVFADLRGLPPLFIQVGSHEVLLDDALTIAARAARADVDVTLRVGANLTHVFTTFLGLLDEAEEGLHEVADFLAGHLGKVQK